MALVVATTARVTFATVVLIPPHKPRSDVMAIVRFMGTSTSAPNPTNGTPKLNCAHLEVAPVAQGAPRRTVATGIPSKLLRAILFSETWGLLRALLGLPRSVPRADPPGGQ